MYLSQADLTDEIPGNSQRSAYKMLSLSGEILRCEVGTNVSHLWRSRTVSPQLVATTYHAQVIDCGCIPCTYKFNILEGVCCEKFLKRLIFELHLE